MVVFWFISGCVAADGPGMVELMSEVGYSRVADGPEMVEFVWESGCSSVADGLGMGYVMVVCVGDFGGSFCHLIQ